jgi:alcohol dehydrogenase
MGGVGMLGGPGLEIPYPWIMRNLITLRGQRMYSQDAVTRPASLVHAGLLDLSQYSVSEFDLTNANEAVIHAHASRSAFNLTIIRP